MYKMYDFNIKKIKFIAKYIRNTINCKVALWLNFLSYILNK